MQQVHFIQKLYTKFFPQAFLKGLKLRDLPVELEALPPEEKKRLASEKLTEAEELLKKEDLTAIELFNEASHLDPTNPLVWYRQGMAFFEYGCNANKEKPLLLAGKNLKIAVSLDSDVFDYWWAWGNILFLLGTKSSEHHYFIEAKQKFKNAIARSQNQTDDVLAELYWDYGATQKYISENSGEAIDLKLAIESFQKSHLYQKDPSSSFFLDFGDAYFKMAKLINEPNIYLQAAEYFKISIEKSKKNIDAIYNLGHVYKKLYENSLDENYFNLANISFEKASELNPLDSNIWLSWANLLNESSKSNKDTKKIRGSIEKCIRAHRRDKKNQKIIGQWVESLSMLGAYTNRLDLIVEAESKIMKATDLYSEDSNLWFSYGICQKAFGIYYQDSDYDYFAIEKFQIGLSIDRTNEKLWNELANTHAKIGKDIEDVDMLERSLKFYLKAIDLKPMAPSIIFDYAIALTNISELTTNLKTIEEAVKQFEIALNMQKNAILSHPDWIYFYGIALDLMGDALEKENLYIKAIEIFNNVLLVDPDYPKIHLKLALTYSHLLEVSSKQEYFEKSNSCFKLASRQDLEDDVVWLEWGLMLISYSHESLSFDNQRQLFIEAEQKIINAGQLGNQHAYYHLACLYSLLNRFEEAVALLEKAKIQDMLPPLDEMLDDEWLEPLKETELFQQFLYKIEKKQNI